MQVHGSFKLTWVKLINNAFSFPFNIVCLKASSPSGRKLLKLQGGPAEDCPQEWVWWLAAGCREAISVTFKENGLRITLWGGGWQSESLSPLWYFNPPAPQLQNRQHVASIWCLREKEPISENEGAEGQLAGWRAEGGVMAHEYVSATPLKLDSSAPTNSLDYSDPKYSSSLINWGEKAIKATQAGGERWNVMALLPRAQTVPW